MSNCDSPPLSSPSRHISGGEGVPEAPTDSQEGGELTAEFVVGHRASEVSNVYLYGFINKYFLPRLFLGKRK